LCENKICEPGEEYTCPQDCGMPTECTDSDGGANPYLSGILTYDYMDYTDYCIDDAYILEYSCQSDPSNPGYVTQKIRCEFGCKEGACLKVPPPAEICTDSDGGLNYYLKGSVSDKGDKFEDKCVTLTTSTISYYVQKDGKNYIYNNFDFDECTGADCYVAEAYCSSGEEIAQQFDIFKCTDGCKDGACIKKYGCSADYDCPQCACQGGVECNCPSYVCVSGECAKGCEDDSDCMELACPDGGFVHEQCDSGHCVQASKCPEKKCVIDSDCPQPNCACAGEIGCNCIGAQSICVSGECERGCEANSECKANEFCYQPTMPICVTPIGNSITGAVVSSDIECTQVMPKSYCREKTCTDSDSGLNYYLKGSIKYNQGMVADDSCTLVVNNVESPVSSCSGANCNVREYSCEDSNVVAQPFHCLNGCKDGACIEKNECSGDSDCPQLACPACEAGVGCSCPNYFCVSGECERGCQADSECRSGEFCYRAAGFCHDAGNGLVSCPTGILQPICKELVCTTDTDCGIGKYCYQPRMPDCPAGLACTQAMPVAYCANTTYSWVNGSYGACSKTCGSGSQSRTVVCRSSDGSNVSDSYCSGTKPPVSASCNTQACCTSSTKSGNDASYTYPTGITLNCNAGEVIKTFDCNCAGDTGKNEKVNECTIGANSCYCDCWGGETINGVSYGDNSIAYLTINCSSC
jgi:hypothetical protein